MAPGLWEFLLLVDHPIYCPLERQFRVCLSPYTCLCVFCLHCQTCVPCHVFLGTQVCGMEEG